MKLATVLLHDQFYLTCLFVYLSLSGNPLDEIFVFDITRAFANDRAAVLLPLTYFDPYLDFGAIDKQNLCTQLHMEYLERLNRFVVQ